MYKLLIYININGELLCAAEVCQRYITHIETGDSVDQLADRGVVRGGGVRFFVLFFLRCVLSFQFRY